MHATTVNGLKRRAKQIKRSQNICHSQALDVAAQESGYNNYKEALAKMANQSSEVIK